MQIYNEYAKALIPNSNQQYNKCPLRRVYGSEQLDLR